MKPTRVTRSILNYQKGKTLSLKIDLLKCPFAKCLIPNGTQDEENIMFILSFVQHMV